ncbi:fibrillin-1-like [Physella acuta]|uniref:fibrillin-1-like n=1 Tax=Physella acuta TaxID=109671 RepID=UPI0027DB316F|nr:fibrillin-1-like [Physella acuta]
MVAKSRLLQNNKRNKLCCYKMKSPESDTWQDWEQSWRDSSYTYGHVLINDPWPWVNFNNMEALENIEAHTLCCEHSPKLMCDRFYKIFPDMKCTDYVYFVPASALGDPHITTLDGFTYTMNGWGEYIMLEIPAANFSFQARTGRAETSDGRLTNATVFTALAARESTESSLQVQLAPNSSTMIVYINGIDYTYDFYETPDFRTNLLTISVIRENRMNKTKLIASFPSGVTIKVTAALKSLEIETEVDKTWMNQTIVGLLGNFNGNVTDEFTLPNGTVLPINMTEKDIFYKFAKLWEVTQSSSIFSYDKLENSSTYQHPEFVPMFLDEEDRATVEEANRICGNLSYACIYDYVATLDQMFAQSTKASVAKQVLQKDALENSPPKLKVDNNTLNTNGYLALTEGVESFFFVEVEDDDHDPVTIETVGNLKGTTVNQQEKKISVKPNVTSPITLGIRALDSKGAYSSIENIIISVCTNCSNHGHCDPGSVREFLSFYFLVLQCICDPAYTGINCETEVDACATRPCSPGQNCTDLTAAQQGSNTTGYICGPCPAGYTDQAGRCVDEDECASDPDICDQQCTNTEGSYYCSCNTGYRLDQINKRFCSDINECDEKMSGCKQLCVNTEGSYNCSCYEGYQLNNDRFTCDLDKTVIDKCLNCQHTCILSRQNGTSICQCDKGYVTDPNNTTECLDVDECSLANVPCSQTCQNTKGSFHCSCYPGFQLLTDGVSCQKCELPNYGENCTSKCDCKGRGNCDTVKGCMCDDGWTGVSCDVDEDECADHTTCPEGFICENTIGSFLCKCPDGYVQQSNRCIDIDECVDIGVNMTCDLRVEVCLNTAGSYRCECKTGYARDVKSLCQDIDECELQIDGCQHICHNVDGKYNCQCQPGYILRENRRDCISVKDLCAGANLNCTQGCSLDKNNQPTCICYRGYNKTIENGAQLCKDKDECASNETNKCSYKDKCTNTEGGYTCSCPAGFSLDNNGWNCLACTGDTWGINCQHSCSCGLGAESCSPVSGCVCKHGFTGFYCETDIDECIEGSVICKSNEVCVNIPGNASCVCKSGFKISDNNSCSDIDECAEPTLNNCTQVCNNTEGSYSCSCHAGYSYNRPTDSCEDIDECQAKLSKCQQICENTEGSYRCKCNRGLYLGLDGVSCVV